VSPVQSQVVESLILRRGSQLHGRGANQLDVICTGRTAHRFALREWKSGGDLEDNRSCGGDYCVAFGVKGGTWHAESGATVRFDSNGMGVFKESMERKWGRSKV